VTRLARRGHEVDGGLERFVVTFPDGLRGACSAPSLAILIARRLLDPSGFPKLFDVGEQIGETLGFALDLGSLGHVSVLGELGEGVVDLPHLFAVFGLVLKARLRENHGE